MKTLFLIIVLLIPSIVFGELKEGFDLDPKIKLELVSPDSLDSVKSPVRAGQFALKFNIAENQELLNYGVRSEITYDNGDVEGSEVWYAWSFMVPEDYIESPPNLFQIMGQWHDQPNSDIGETWENYPHNSPPVAVYYGNVKLSEIPKFLLAEWKQLPYWNDLVHNGTVSGVSIVVGIGDSSGTIATIPIVKGQWNDMMFHIKWSSTTDGFVEVFHNDALMGVTITKRNMWNNYPHYLKLGLYRHSSIPHANHLFYDEIRIGNSRADVTIQR